MTFDLVLVLSFITLGFLVLYFSLSRKLKEPKMDNTLIEWLKSLQGSLNTNNQTITQTLQRSYQDLHARLDHASQIMGELKREAGAFSEVGRSMRDLQDYLKSPKLRGNIGEQVLKDLVGQMFPKKSFLLQHHFKTGVIVDIAIQTDAGLLPIDSKFPLENFQKLMKASDSDRESHRSDFIRDVKKHVKDISSKYILPQEGTTDFALMYLPSESVYYEVVAETDLLDYARTLRVYPVSPTTLYAHLQTILLSFEGKKFESKSKEIFATLRGIQKDYEKLDGNLSTLNKHLTNAFNQMSQTNQIMSGLGQKLSSTKSLSSLPEE